MSANIKKSTDDPLFRVIAVVAAFVIVSLFFLVVCLFVFSLVLTLYTGCIVLKKGDIGIIFAKAHVTAT